MSKHKGMSAEHMAKIRPSQPKLKTKKKFSKKELKILYDWYGPKYKYLIDKIAQGNIRAAMKLHCLDCVAYIRSEITKCSCKACAFYLLRPFQKKDEPPKD